MMVAHGHVEGVRKFDGSQKRNWGGFLAPGDRGCASSLVVRCLARNQAVKGSIPSAAWAALGDDQATGDAAVAAAVITTAVVAATAAAAVAATAVAAATTVAAATASAAATTVVAATAAAGKERCRIQNNAKNN